MVRRIVSSTNITKSDTVLEIGAGTGLLTAELAKVAGKVVAVELDAGLEKTLRNIGKGNVEVIIGNILNIIGKIKFDKIVSNIPYSICEPLAQILFHVKFQSAVLTVPVSSARILIGEEPGSKISLLSKLFFVVKPLFDVPKSAFSPPPGTESVAVEINPREFETEEENVLAEVFLDEKKKTKNSLREALIKAFNLTKRQAMEKIKLTGISAAILGKKPPELSSNETGELIRKIRESQGLSSFQ